MELATYKMRNGDTLVLFFNEFTSVYVVTVYNRSDIEERSWEFYEKVDGQKKFDEVKQADQSPLTETGAKK